MKHKYNTKHFCPPCKICVWAFVLLIKYMCGLLSSFLKISVRGFVLWAFVRLPFCISRLVRPTLHVYTSIPTMIHNLYMRLQ